MEISFLKFGEKGKKIVFLHGWQQDKRSFSPLVPFLFKKYQLFLLDFPGFGQTPLPKNDITLNQYSQIITQWIIEKKLTPIILVGHSFGGKIASVIASSNPKIINKLILISPSGIPTPKFWYRIKKFIPPNLSRILSPLIRPLTASRDYKNAGILLPLFKTIVKEDLRPFFAKINIPTLIIWGRDDQELPVKQAYLIHQFIKTSKLKLIPGEHLMFQKNPQPVARLISDFIENEKT